ncbi:MAG TPA: hypothetical protein VK190_02465 [Pseudoneobacillus sp.]|nr:hypothetical protein [Pseudoneobacillus sp.]
MENNALVVRTELANKIAAVLPGLFNDIDFNGLNNALDKIGDSSANLSLDEKNMAVGIVMEWEGSVIKRLYEKDREMSSFLNFFNIATVRFYGYHGYHYDNSVYGIDEDKMEALAQQTNTVNEFIQYINAKERLTKFQQTRPEQPEEDDSLSYQDNFMAVKNYEVAMLKYNIEEKKLIKNVAEKERAWKELLQENEGIKELIKKAKKFNKGLNKLIDQCKDKTQIARLNISISSKDARTAIRELMDFSLTI